MRIKKIWFLLQLVALLIISFNISVFAESSETVVGGESLPYGSDQLVSVPVIIKNNPGLMGYKMFVEYPADVVRVDTVKRGVVTEKGNFSNNCETAGKIIVVWNNTSEVTADGSLFEIIFEVSDSQKNAEIKLSYSEADTFNEQYKDVTFDTRSIWLVSDVHEDTTEEEVSDADVSSSSDTQEEVPLENTAVLKALDEAIKNYDLNDLSEEDEEMLLKEAAQVVNEAAGTNDQTFSSIKEFEFFYSEIKTHAATEQIEKEYSAEIIADTVSKVLEDIGVTSVDELTEDEKSEFSESIKELLETNENTISELNDDEVIKTVTKLLSEKEESEKKEIKSISETESSPEKGESKSSDEISNEIKENESSSEKENKGIPFALWAVIGAFSVCGVGCLIYIIMKKRQGRKTK